MATSSYGSGAFLGYWVRRTAGTHGSATSRSAEQMTSRRPVRSRADTGLRRLRELYADDLPAPGRAAAHGLRTSIAMSGRWRSCRRVPHWHRGRMVLVGDSAHAPSHSSGQGASLAVESAVSWPVACGICRLPQRVRRATRHCAGHGWKRSPGAPQRPTTARHSVLPAITMMRLDDADRNQDISHPRKDARSRTALPDRLGRECDGGGAPGCLASRWGGPTIMGGSG